LPLSLIKKEHTQYKPYQQKCQQGAHKNYKIDFLILILHRKPIEYKIYVNTIIILKIVEILLAMNGEACCIKLISANMGNIRTVLNKTAETIQKAGKLARDWASVF